MVKFSDDVDILKYEPVLFGELHLPWQVLAQGADGSLTGATLTAAGADFVGAGVCAGGVVYLSDGDGAINGAYEIVSVDSATQLTVSVLRANSEDSPVAPPSADNISYRVSTYAPQATEAAFALTEYFGIKPGNPASDIEAEDILDSAVLKQASVFVVISSVYATLAGSRADEDLWQKSWHYRKLFEKARQRVRLVIDSDSDGIADSASIGGAVRLVRD